MDFEPKTKPKTVETLNHDELCELILAAIKVSGILPCLKNSQNLLQGITK